MENFSDNYWTQVIRSTSQWNLPPYWEINKHGKAIAMNISRIPKGEDTIMRSRSKGW
jgi:hypothetical protein